MSDGLDLYTFINMPLTFCFSVYVYLGHAVFGGSNKTLVFAASISA